MRGTAILNTCFIKKNESEVSLWFSISPYIGPYGAHFKKIVPWADSEKMPLEILNRVSRRETPFGLNRRTR